jgi:hypothetical protein
LRVAISYLTANVLVVASYMGFRVQRFYQHPMRWSNPKYGATRYAVIDMATRKNVFPGIQVKNSSNMIPIDCNR